MIWSALFYKNCNVLAQSGRIIDGDEVGWKYISYFYRRLSIGTWPKAKSMHVTPQGLAEGDLLSSDIWNRQKWDQPTTNYLHFLRRAISMAYYGTQMWTSCWPMWVCILIVIEFLWPQCSYYYKLAPTAQIYSVMTKFLCGQPYGCYSCVKIHILHTQGPGGGPQQLFQGGFWLLKITHESRHQYGGNLVDEKYSKPV